MTNLTAIQRVLLYTLTRRRCGNGPFAVIISSERTARELAGLGLVTVQPHDDLGLMWVAVTPAGRAVAVEQFGKMIEAAS